MKVQVGDVVRMKSGGPKMTVIQIDEFTAWCRWFWWVRGLGNATLYGDRFPFECLEGV